MPSTREQHDKPLKVLLGDLGVLAVKRQKRYRRAICACR
jgi:hypothetical protein